MTPDYCRLSGAETLAARIRAYWARRGMEVRIGPIGGDGAVDRKGTPVFSVRSDMVDGYPRSRVGEAT